MVKIKKRKPKINNELKLCNNFVWGILTENGKNVSTTVHKHCERDPLEYDFVFGQPTGLP